MAKKRYDYFADEPKNTASSMEVLDCNGNLLQPGDSIIATKGLAVKGGSDIKKGEKFTNISFTSDPEEIQARHKKNGKMSLKTTFFKKG